jgi:non-ribosomal peptide synthetase component F
MIPPHPEDTTVHRAFARIARAHPDRTFLHVLPEVAVRCGIAPVELGYGRALDAAESIAARFAAAGYGHGHGRGPAYAVGLLQGFVGFGLGLRGGWRRRW